MSSVMESVEEINASDVLQIGDDAPGVYIDSGDVELLFAALADVRSDDLALARFKRLLAESMRDDAAVVMVTLADP